MGWTDVQLWMSAVIPAASVAGIMPLC